MVTVVYSVFNNENGDIYADCNNMQVDTQSRKTAEMYAVAELYHRYKDVGNVSIIINESFIDNDNDKRA